jgi:hypothetical protein
VRTGSQRTRRSEQYAGGRVDRRVACGALELVGALGSNDQRMFDQPKLQKLELCVKNSKNKSYRVKYQLQLL